MPDGQDNFDGLLTRHFVAELEGQRGRCAKAFTAQIAAAHRRRVATWAVAGAMAAAAAVALALLGPRIPPKTQPVARHPQMPQTPHLSPVERTIASRTFDDGTVLVRDDVAVRRFRRQLIERVQWYDPQQRATIQVTVPREQIVLVGLPQQ